MYDSFKSLNELEKEKELERKEHEAWVSYYKRAMFAFMMMTLSLGLALLTMLYFGVSY